MTIKSAIFEAKRNGMWNAEKPTSVNVLYMTKWLFEDETQLDLYSDDKEKELISLWKSLEVEMGALNKSVIQVETLGYIAD